VLVDYNCDVDDVRSNYKIPLCVCVCVCNYAVAKQWVIAWGRVFQLCFIRFECGVLPDVTLHTECCYSLNCVVCIQSLPIISNRRFLHVLRTVHVM